MDLGAIYRGLKRNYFSVLAAKSNYRRTSVYFRRADGIIRAIRVVQVDR